MPEARHTRLMAMRLSPLTFAILRTLQRPPSGGVVSSVRTTTSASCSWVRRRGAPRLGPSHKPSSRARTNRWRHLHTVAGDTRSRRATVLLSCPALHAMTIRARSAASGALRERWAIDSSRRCSSVVNTNAVLGRPVRLASPAEDTWLISVPSSVTPQTDVFGCSCGPNIAHQPL